jgi:phage terminase large subunit-like protein
MNTDPGAGLGLIEDVIMREIARKEEEGSRAGKVGYHPSMAAFEAAVLGGKLRHGGNPLLRMGVANVAIESDAAGNRKPSTRRSRGRIDPAVSAVYAIGTASRDQPAPEIEPHLRVLIA